VEYRFAYSKRGATQPAIFLIKHYNMRPELRHGDRTLCGEAGQDYNYSPNSTADPVGSPSFAARHW